MAVSRVQTSSILQGFPKSRSLLAGNAAFNPTSFESIATVMVGAGGSSTVSFTSIPSTYKHLQIRGIERAVNNIGGDDPGLRLNGDTGSNYISHTLDGNGASVVSLGGSGRGIALTNILYNYYGSDASLSADVFSGVVIDILDYSDTSKYKVTRTLSGTDNNGSGHTSFQSGLWLSTSTISSITLTPTAGNWAQYTTYALYGVN